jgi:hypothetical protein
LYVRFCWPPLLSLASRALPYLASISFAVFLAFRLNLLTSEAKLMADRRAVEEARLHLLTEHEKLRAANDVLVRDVAHELHDALANNVRDANMHEGRILACFFHFSPRTFQRIVAHDGAGMLALAIRSGSVRLVGALLRANKSLGVNRIDLNASVGGLTPIMLAATVGSPEIFTAVFEREHSALDGCKRFVMNALAKHDACRALAQSFAVRVIQSKYRQHLGRRVRAVNLIKKAWIETVYNPDSKLGAKRVIRIEAAWNRLPAEKKVIQ